MTMANRDSPKPSLGGPANLHQTWKILAGGAEGCAQALIEIAESGASEASRVAAAKTVLEMVGFRGSATTVVPILPVEFDPAGAPAGEGTSPASRIRSRMAALAATAPEDPEVVDADLVTTEVEVVDGEIVDD